MIGALTAQLLRREIGQGTQHRAGACGIVSRQAGNAEVGQPRIAGAVEENVGRLHITMHDATLMRRIERRGHLSRNAHGVVYRQRARIEPLRQRTAGTVGHGQKQTTIAVHADIVHAGHVRMIERSRRTGFHEKSRSHERALLTRRRGGVFVHTRKELERDSTREPVIVGQPHRAHAAAADLTHETIRTNGESRRLGPATCGVHLRQRGIGLCSGCLCTGCQCEEPEEVATALINIQQRAHLARHKWGVGVERGESRHARGHGQLGQLSEQRGHLRQCTLGRPWRSCEDRRDGGIRRQRPSLRVVRVIRHSAECGARL
jgi:hypothetical protein